MASAAPITGPAPVCGRCEYERYGLFSFPGEKEKSDYQRSLEAGGTAAPETAACRHCGRPLGKPPEPTTWTLRRMLERARGW